jgi:hypothetical protein
VPHRSCLKVASLQISLASTVGRTAPHWAALGRTASGTAHLTDVSTISDLFFNRILPHLENGFSSSISTGFAVKLIFLDMEPNADAFGMDASR